VGTGLWREVTTLGLSKWALMSGASQWENCVLELGGVGYLTQDGQTQSHRENMNLRAERREPGAGKVDPSLAAATLNEDSFNLTSTDGAWILWGCWEGAGLGLTLPLTTKRRLRR